jgi:hypothetical protein
MTWFPVPAVGVYVTEQLEDAVLSTWARVQGLVKLPVPLLLKLTLPVGKVWVPVSVSLTVAVQVVGLLNWTDAGEQLTDVEVVRKMAVMSNVPLLMSWVLSPP